VSHMSYEVDRDPAKEPSLAEMARKAIEILSKNPEGFFLLIEGGRVDHAGHQNCAAGVLFNMLAFDDAIGVALEYAKRDPNTLIIVAGDHETGGMALIGDKGEKVEHLRRLGGLRASNEVIAKELKGVTCLDTIKHIIERHTGVAITTEEARWIVEGKELDPLHPHLHPDKYYPVNWIGWAIQDEINVAFVTGHHTAEPVLIFAVGPYSEEFRGFLDNTDVAKIMSEAFRTGY